MSYLWCPEHTVRIQSQFRTHQEATEHWHNLIADWRRRGAVGPPPNYPTQTIEHPCRFVSRTTGQIYPWNSGPQDWNLAPNENRARYLPELYCQTHPTAQIGMFFRYTAVNNRRQANERLIARYEYIRPTVPEQPGFRNVWAPGMYWYTLNRPEPKTIHDFIYTTT